MRLCEKQKVRNKGMSKLITLVIPMCFGFLFSNALRNKNYESAFVAIIGIVACLAVVLMGVKE